jgi:uncharacterized protein
MNVPQIMTAQVMHKRIFPSVNQFVYGVFYLWLPLKTIAAQKSNWLLGVNRPAFFSFYNRDHGNRDDSDLEVWAKDVLNQAGIKRVDGDITLITFPRVLGYVLNPVSFWICENSKKQIIAVICEVNNTFGQTHTYVCSNQDETPINPEEWLEGDKVFHVSPFLKREGVYRFRFSMDGACKGLFIDYYDGQGQKQLITSVIGTLNPLNTKTLLSMVWRYPLVTLKAIALIHWQAIKLMLKGIKYIPKPKQSSPRITFVQKNNTKDF